LVIKKTKNKKLKTFGSQNGNKYSLISKVFKVLNSQMASIETYIEEFIAEHELDSDDIKEPITDLINKCLGALFKHLYAEQIPENAPAKKTVGTSNKAKKDEKIENPSQCEKLEDLRNCTTGILNQFSKDNGLKVGGNKKELMDRVWRFLQGTGSDDDQSPRSKPKKVKAAPEKHLCFGCNAKGAPCAMAATEEHDDHWFCWRHISSAAEIIEKKSESEPETEPEKPKKTKKAPVVEAEKPKKSKKKVELVESEEEA